MAQRPEQRKCRRHWRVSPFKQSHEIPMRSTIKSASTALISLASVTFFSIQGAYCDDFSEGLRQAPDTIHLSINFSNAQSPPTLLDDRRKESSLSKRDRTERNHPYRSQPEQQEAHHAHNYLRKAQQPERDLKTLHYLPNWSKDTCTIPITLESWQESQSRPTLGQCCQDYFQWRVDECIAAGKNIPTSLPTHKPTGDSDVDMAPQTFPYIPIWSSYKCTNEREPLSNEKKYDTMERCCKENFEWKLEVCDPASVLAAEQEPKKIYQYIPVWSTFTCTNEVEPPPMEKTYKTLEECCNKNFEWKLEECLPEGPVDDTADGSDNNLPSAPPEYWFYPVWAGTKCILDDGKAADYMYTNRELYFFDTFRGCCEKSFIIDSVAIDACIENSAPLAPPTRPPSVDNDLSVVDISYEDYFYPSYTQNYCIKNGDNAPNYMKKDPMTFFAFTVDECCDFQFPTKYDYCITTSNAKLPETDVDTVKDEYDNWFYPSFRTEICANTNDENLQVPMYMWENPEGFFYTTIEVCCQEHYVNVKIDCIRRSKSYILGGVLDTGVPDGDTIDLGVGINPDVPGIIVIFNGRLYFQNVFIPTTSPKHLETIRDVVAGAVKTALNAKYPTAEVAGKVFDGLDLNNLNGVRKLSHHAHDNHSRELSRMQLFTFNATIRVDCDRICVRDIKSSGRQVSHDISATFDDAIRDGTVFSEIKNDMAQMGQVGPFFTASLDEGYLMYDSSIEDTDRGTWAPTTDPTYVPSGMPTIMPSESPSSSPSESPTRLPTPPPTMPPTHAPTEPFKFYPRYDQFTCRADGQHSEFEVHFYNTLEECCNHPWLQKTTCLILGAAFTNPPTTGPTTPKPVTSPPTHHPTSVSTSASTVSPTKAPTHTPTNAPIMTLTTGVPTFKPTSLPTTRPTNNPAIAPKGQIVEDFEFGLSSAFQWYNSKPYSWVADDTIAMSGALSMRNTIPPGGQTCTLSLTLNSETGGLITYGIRHDIFMPWSVLRIEDNGEIVETVAGHSGEPKWSVQSVTLDPGEHEVAWIIWRSNSDSLPVEELGQGLVWLDAIKYTPGLSFNFDLGVFDMNYVRFSGVGTWAIDDSQPANDDGLAAHSPKFLLPGEHSVMSITYDVPQPGGKITFGFVLGMGTFSFYIDGEKFKDSNTPSTKATTFSYSLTPGEHKFDWKYDAPSIPNLPLSMVWVDNIQIMPLLI